MARSCLRCATGSGVRETEAGRERFSPGSEQVLGVSWIEWWHHGAARRLPATGLETPLACLSHATQERRGVPYFLAPGGHETLQLLRLVPHSLVAIALREMPQLRRGRTGFQPVELAQQGVEGAVHVTGARRSGETAEARVCPASSRVVLIRPRSWSAPGGSPAWKTTIGVFWSGTSVAS